MEKGPSTYSIECADGSSCIGSGFLIGFMHDALDSAVAQWNTRADLSQAAITAAMMGAVKPLEWVRGIVDYAKPLAGVKYVACSRTPAGQWTWWLDGESKIQNVFQSEAEAKAAAEADWQARNAALRVIPADALAALGAALVGAYKEGWSDGAANCHHDRNETPHEGWLISDTYKSIPTDAAAALEAVKTQVRDDTVRSAAIAAGNAIVRLATNADPDNSPLRKQMLRVKMEKAVKAAFTRDA